MNILDCLIYGLISGFAEFIPISSQAHQNILRSVSGSSISPLQDLLINVALLVAILIGCWSMLKRLHRETRKAKSRRIYNARNADARSLCELRLVKTSAIPMVVGMIVLIFILPATISLPAISILLIVNGAVLYVTDHLRHGNKDARSISRLDSILIGCCGAFSVFPGISRVGFCSCAAIARGADKQHALNWSLLLSIPGIIIMIGKNLLDLFSSGAIALDFMSVIYCLLGAVLAFSSAYACILLMRFFTAKIGHSGFAYYCWGLALFTFILYLI